MLHYASCYLFFILPYYAIYFCPFLLSELHTSSMCFMKRSKRLPLPGAKPGQSSSCSSVAASEERQPVTSWRTTDGNLTVTRVSGGSCALPSPGLQDPLKKPPPCWVSTQVSSKPERGTRFLLLRCIQGKALSFKQKATSLSQHTVLVVSRILAFLVYFHFHWWGFPLFFPLCSFHCFLSSGSIC